LIWVSDYFDGWLPACAGMTGFFVMYRDQIIRKEIIPLKKMKINRKMTMRSDGINDSLCI